MEEELKWWDVRPEHKLSLLTFRDVFSNTQPESSASEGRQKTELGLKCPRVKQDLPHQVWEPGIPFSRPSADPCDLGDI